jgi:hypothetical protein
VFEVNRKTGAETVVHAFAGGRVGGSYRAAALVNVGGTPYGTAVDGGLVDDDRSVFAMDVTATVYRIPELSRVQLRRQDFPSVIPRGTWTAFLIARSLHSQRQNDPNGVD